MFPTSDNGKVIKNHDLLLWFTTYEHHYVSRDARKPVFGDSDQVWHKPVCTVTERARILKFWLYVAKSSSSSYPFYSPLSSTEGWTCLTSLLLRRPLHSELFWGSAVSIPSFFLSSNNTSSHDFLGLPDLFCATMFSLRTWAIQPLLRSTCPYHLILLERSTTSISWSPSFRKNCSIHEAKTKALISCAVTAQLICSFFA